MTKKQLLVTGLSVLGGISVFAREMVELPPEGVYVGSGVYTHNDRLMMTGLCFARWVTDGPSPDECIKWCKSERQGNIMQFWQGGTNLLRVAKLAREEGLYVTCLGGGRGTPETVKAIHDLGGFVGLDYGERFAFDLTEKGIPDLKDDGTGGPVGPTLRDAAERLVARVKKDVAASRAQGWQRLMVTSANFSYDYEIAAGIDVPCTEDFAFGPLTVSTALSRGLYRQHDLPMWGSHLAHEWYSWIPHANPAKMETLRLALYHKLFSGAKLIINESGNWALQSTLGVDEPMHFMPRPAGDPKPLICCWKPEQRDQYEKPVIDQARKEYWRIGYTSEVARAYRRVIGDFWDWCKINHAPKGQPETTLAVVKGNFDLAGWGFNHGKAVAGAYSLAERDPRWFEGAPEAGWGIIEDLFFPRPPELFAPNNNRLFGGTPYGQVDIVSFAIKAPSAGFLLKNYKTLIFCGWNTCSVEQYKVLCDYVNGGGRLVISLPHLSTDERRDYGRFVQDRLVNGGDFSELCGLKVEGVDQRFYWATGPSREPNAFGLAAPRRYGIMGCPSGRLVFTGPESDYEMLSIDDEMAHPVIVRCRRGKGETIFINTWAYPGAVDLDNGPGATLYPRGGLMSAVYRYAATLSRGTYWITAADGRSVDADCEHVFWSYFPEEEKLCCLNLDLKGERSFLLHRQGRAPVKVTLKPGEARVMKRGEVEQASSDSWARSARDCFSSEKRNDSIRHS